MHAQVPADAKPAGHDTHRVDLELSARLPEGQPVQLDLPDDAYEPQGHAILRVCQSMNCGHLCPAGQSGQLSLPCAAHVPAPHATQLVFPEFACRPAAQGVHASAPWLDTRPAGQESHDVIVPAGELNLPEAQGFISVLPTKSFSIEVLCRGQ